MLNEGHRWHSFALRTGANSTAISEFSFLAGTTNPPTGASPSGRAPLGATQAAIYFCQAATSAEDVQFWTVDGGTTWTKLATLSDLLLPAVTDKTVASGVVTLTAAAHTVRGEGAASDNVDTISGMTSTEVAILVTGAEAITYRDFAIGAGNISTSGDASIVTATGDVVLAVLSGSLVRVTPLVIAAGLPVGMNALARGRLLRGSSTGLGEALDISAAGAIAQGDGTDVAAVTLPSTGMLAKTAATTWAGRTITGTASEIVVTDGDGVAGNPTLKLGQYLVKATAACADATGGATTALLSVQLTDLSGVNLTAARQVLLMSGTLQYNPDSAAPNASLSLGTVTAGSVIATPAAGVAWLIETDATGLFACTATNTDDETLYFSVLTASGGVSDTAKGCAVIVSNSGAAAWSA